MDSALILTSGCHQVSKAACILTTQNLMRILRSKEAAASVNIKTWPTIIDTGKLHATLLTDTQAGTTAPDSYSPLSLDFLFYFNMSPFFTINSSFPHLRYSIFASIVFAKFFSLCGCSQTTFLAVALLKSISRPQRR